MAHASWNAIAHSIKDTYVTIALLGTGSALFGLPLALLAPRPTAFSMLLLVLSCSVHVTYTLLLMLSYRLGDFSQMYPLARGTSPIVVTVFAAVLLAELPSPGEIAGVALIVAALLGLALAGRRVRNADGGADHRAVVAAIATGLAIAVYTVIDGIAVRRSGSPLGYAGWLIALEGVALAGVALAVRRRALVDQARPVWLRGVVGGGLSLLAYGLVLWAQTRGALAAVSALRETSIVAGALIGTLVFGERFGRTRVLASAAVVAGIVLITLG